MDKYSEIKRNELSTLATTQINLEIIIWSDRNQMKRIICVYFVEVFLKFISAEFTESCT